MSTPSETSFASCNFVADRLPMSRPDIPSSVALSDLEQMTLISASSRDSSLMGVTTRSAARTQSASRSDAIKTEGSGGGAAHVISAASAHSSLPSGPPTGAQASPTAAAPEDDGDDYDSEDDSEDEDEDDDDDEDDDGADQPSPPQDPQAARARQLFAMLSVFEPSHLSYEEFIQPDLEGRSEASTLYRELTVALSRLVRTEADVQLLSNAVPVQGQAWSRQLVKIMENRWLSYRNDFNMYYNLTRQGQRPQGTDVDGTIVKICSLFEAIETTLRNFPRMGDSNNQGLIDVLVMVFETLPDYTEDARSLSPNAPAYAGGATQFEHNLFLRFVAIKSNWLPCLEVLRRLGERGHKPQIRQNQQRWRGVYRRVYESLVDPRVGFPGDSQQFLLGLRNRLIAMGVQFD